MGIKISQIKNQNLKELATLVDNSFNGKTRSNGVIDDCEVSVFIDKAKKFGMGAECAQVLGLGNVTQQNKVIKNQQTNKITIRKPVVRHVGGHSYEVTYCNGQKWVKKTKDIRINEEKNAINVFLGIRKALEEQPNLKGMISKKSALKLLQNVFEKGVNTYSNGRSVDGENLLTIKRLFDLYMDKDSDGGENITQQEQFAIMRTIDSWTDNYDN